MTEDKPSRAGPLEPGFASRWSRLKRAAAEPAEEHDDAASEIAGPAPVEDPRSDAEVLAELGLPDPDALKPGDDFRAFMARAVPARIRNRALRRLWLSNPVLANVDGLVDYGGDFSDAATMSENLQTAYQVGKGFVDRTAGSAGGEPEPEVARGQGADTGHAEDVAADTGAEAASDAEEDAVGDTVESAESPEAEPPPRSPDAAQPAPAVRPRRHMRFRLAED